MNLVMYFLSVLFGCLGAWLVMRFGDRLGFVDFPSERSSHFSPTPKGGAIGILAGFVITAVYFEVSQGLWMPAAGLSLVSLLGDRHDLTPKIRLMVQFSCSFVFLACLFNSRDVHFMWYWGALPLAVYIVGTSNFYNFMDGINGIAGITGIVGFFLLAVYGTLTGADPKYVALSVAVACMCLGFLPYNMPKAKVFMGDIGSILLGFVFACTSLILSGSVLDFTFMAGFLFPFYADELTTMCIRIRSGESLGKPHRRHLYQILANECGVDHWRISLGYGIVQLFIGIVLIKLRFQWDVALIFLAGCLVIFSLVSACVRNITSENHFTMQVK